MYAINGINIGTNVKRYYLQTADIDLSEYTQSNFPTLKVCLAGTNTTGFIYDGGRNDIKAKPCFYCRNRI